LKNHAPQTLGETWFDFFTFLAVARGADIDARRSILKWSGFLSHLLSLTVQMSQKSSVTKTPQSVPQALIPDTNLAQVQQIGLSARALSDQGIALWVRAFARRWRGGSSKFGCRRGFPRTPKELEIAGVRGGAAEGTPLVGPLRPTTF
jgi:hypothetical protein